MATLPPIQQQGVVYSPGLTITNAPMAGGGTVTVFNMSPNFARLAKYRQGMIFLYVFGGIMTVTSIIQFSVLSYYVNFVTLIFGVVSLGAGYLVMRKYQQIKKEDEEQQQQQRQANSTIPQPNLGYPQPNQGYPHPNQGYPHPNQGYPQSNQGYPQLNQGYPHPNQGYPQPNQGFLPPNQRPEQPNQGFQQPSSGFSQLVEGIPPTHNIGYPPNQYYPEQPPPYSAPPSESNISELPLKPEK